MLRLPGILLVFLALLPRVVAGGEATGVFPGDGRAAAVASNVDHFINLAEPGTLKRVLDGGSNGGPGQAPLGGRCAHAAVRSQFHRTPGVIPPGPALLCRPYSERLPYDATAPPSSQDQTLRI